MADSEQILDNPIQAPDADVLGRGAFVTAVSNEIRKWNGKTSLVIGLHGKWGDGKTSVVNLLVPTLIEGGLRVLRFNAWEWSSSDDLTDAFFDEVSVQLGRSSRKDNAELAKAMRRYGTRLKGGASSFIFLLPLFKGLLYACALFCFVGIWESLFWVRLVAAILAGFAAVVMGVSKLLPMVADAIFPNDAESLPSLERLKLELVTALEKSTERILIVIDDIDRLAPDQLADVTRLVKANGDLPRVCYLLVGDRRVMADHLGIALKLDGPEYLEKIIQLSFDLPAIEQTKLNSFFWGGLNEILSDEVTGRDFEVDRWGQVYWSGLVASLGNLRSAKRLLASLRIAFALTVGKLALEVNQVDLIAIETVRLFEPNLYRALRQSKSALTNSSTDRENPDARAEQVVAEILKDVDVKRHEQWRSLIRLLFPYMDTGRNITYGPHNVRSWAASQRICSPSYFDRYFRFGVGEEEISTSDLHVFLGPGTREEYRDALSSFALRDKLPEIIAGLRERVDNISVAQVEPLVLAIFDVGDVLSPRSEQMFGASASMQGEFLVQDLLKRVPDSDAREVVDRVFRSSEGIRMPVEILRNFLGHQHEKRLERFLCDADLEEWKKFFADRIATWAKSGSLIEAEGAGIYLYFWRMWGDPEDAKLFVATLCETRVGALSFLRAVTQIAHSSNVNKKGETARPYIPITHVSDLIDPETVNANISATEPSDIRLLRLTNPEFRYFEKALNRKREGKSEDGFGFWNDEDDED
jgi:predicted KAP-like P-loop ATPase